MRVTSRASGTGALATEMGAAGANWTGTTIIARNRGRTDIDEGGLPGFFNKGDYILFDAGDAIVVHPANQSFKRLFPRSLDSIPALTNSVSPSVSDVIVTLDSLLPPETIEGKQTSHYRVRMTYVVTIDISNIPGLEATPPRGTEMEQTTDYYYGERFEVPQVGFFSAPAVLLQWRAPSYLQDLTARLTAVISKLPRDKIALRTVATTRIVSSEFSSLRETTTEILQMRSHDAEPAKLLLPKDYKESPGPGMTERADSTSARSDAGEKWRRPPLTP